MLEREVQIIVQQAVKPRTPRIVAAVKAEAAKKKKQKEKEQTVLQKARKKLTTALVPASVPVLVPRLFSSTSTMPTASVFSFMLKKLAPVPNLPMSFISLDSNDEEDLNEEDLADEIIITRHMLNESVYTTRRSSQRTLHFSTSLSPLAPKNHCFSMSSSLT